jgi:hypothetical protein
LRPKIKKKQVRLEDLIVSVDDNAKMENDADLDFNPVVQARMLIEAGEGRGSRRGRNKQRAGAAGALRRLLRSTGPLGKATEGGKRKADRLKQLDRNLAKQAAADEATAMHAAEEARIFQKAEKAALEARKM